MGHGPRRTPRDGGDNRGDESGSVDAVAPRRDRPRVWVAGTPWPAPNISAGSPSSMGRSRRDVPEGRCTQGCTDPWLDELQAGGLDSPSLVRER